MFGGSSNTGYVRERLIKIKKGSYEHRILLFPKWDSRIGVIIKICNFGAI